MSRQFPDFQGLLIGLANVCSKIFVVANREKLSTYNLHIPHASSWYYKPWTYVHSLYQTIESQRILTHVLYTLVCKWMHTRVNIFPGLYIAVFTSKVLDTLWNNKIYWHLEIIRSYEQAQKSPLLMFTKLGL